MASSQKTIKSPVLFRGMDLEDIDEDDRTVVFSFSSEEPVERFFGIEILDHSPGAMRLGRLKTFGPVLVDHDLSDHVGVVVDVSVGADRRGRVKARFGKGARASEIFQDVVDGIRGNVSVGYRVHEMVLVSENDGVKEYRVTDWEPFEVSIVSVPADITVGVGRSSEVFEVMIREDETMSDHDMTVKNEQSAESSNVPTERGDVSVELNRERERAKMDEIARVRDISALGAKYDCRELADKFIAEGKSVSEMTSAILDEIDKRRKDVYEGAGSLDMPKSDARQYSLMRAIQAAATGDWSKAGLEREASKEIASRVGREPSGFFVPTDIGWLSDRTKSQLQQRVLTVGVATAGGYLKGTDHLGDEFIEALYPALVISGMGARIWGGLEGDVDVPAMNASTTTYWVAEDTAPAAGDPSFRQVLLQPRTVAGLVDISRRLMKQSSPSVEQALREDMVVKIASAIDAVAINGGGANQPTGILQTTGIGAVALGANGGAPTYTSQSQLIKEVAIDNALMGNLYFLTNPNVVHTLRTTPKVANTDSEMIMRDTVRTLFGYEVVETTNVPNNLTKGTATGLSAEIFGNFRDLIIGEWGVLDLLVDPYTRSNVGGTRVTVFKDVDVAIARPQSFAAIQDMVTT